MYKALAILFGTDRSFAETELIPNAGKWDKEHIFPAAQVRLVAGGSLTSKGRL